VCLTGRFSAKVSKILLIYLGHGNNPKMTSLRGLTLCKIDNSFYFIKKNATGYSDMASASKHGIIKTVY
jgi:hypothetical protein